MKVIKLKFLPDFIPKIRMGKKTVTRRLAQLIRQEPDDPLECEESFRGVAPGDLAWVPERFKICSSINPLTVQYPGRERLGIFPDDSWFTAPRMPMWAARTWIEFVSFRVEHLQLITPEDAKLEGLESVEEFRTIWDGLGRSRGMGLHSQWEDNPCVWRVEFKYVDDSDARNRVHAARAYR